MSAKIYYIYDIRESLRQYSDDSDISDSHISFLIDDVRAMLLRQKYRDVGSKVPEAIKQRIHLNTELTEDNEFVSLDKILRTANAIPRLIESWELIHSIYIDAGGYKDLKFGFVDQNRFVYAGYDKHLRNLVYVTLGHHYKLYFTSSGEKYKLIEKIRLAAIFEDPKAAWEASADYDADLNFEEDVNYPIDLDMWINIKDIILKQLGMSLSVPQDKNNNADER
jgi:hypothetical protein